MALTNAERQRSFRARQAVQRARALEFVKLDRLAASVQLEMIGKGRRIMAQPPKGAPFDCTDEIVADLKAQVAFCDWIIGDEQSRNNG